NSIFVSGGRVAGLIGIKRKTQTAKDCFRIGGSGLANPDVARFGNTHNAREFYRGLSRRGVASLTNQQPFLRLGVSTASWEKWYIFQLCPEAAFFCACCHCCRYPLRNAPAPPRRATSSKAAACNRASPAKVK